MTAQSDNTPTPSAKDEEPTRALAPADAHSPTLRPGPTEGHVPDDRTAGPDSEYSATVLDSHWIQRPETDHTLVEPVPASASPTRPDRVEGSVLRFGPGVTAAVAHRTVPALAATSSAPAPSGRRRLRKNALPALLVVAVLVLLAWQRFGQPVAVTQVAVTARPTALGCDGTADIVGLVTTNGRPGTLSYRWVRSDGTASGVLHEVLARGERHARLHLRWTYQGPGHRAARAELRILSPGHRVTAARFSYDCP
ncbi:hypothetical protein [Streptomyces sp. Ag109_O5-10]|uniref:hypothetical protein n=1 Tax=Streptomyces sp. Ag109_O5-10 TaxID=1855349 RepID=UPI0008961871|nr:hypothetical protein [Streptomyces sp. Ag109_O5-10]SED97284.1 hypothetical protein SAMN05216533_1064 [Streptomyces sp. Ag109_O5-10]